MCRFYDPDEGRILLDGVDLRTLDREALRRQITVLFQEPVHYHATVRENIAFGDINELSDQARIREAARAAGSTDERFHEVGDVLFAAVNAARKLKVDPELALRAAADRFRARVQAGVDLAASDGRNWNDLPPDGQLAYYARARLSEGDPHQT